MRIAAVSLVLFLGACSGGSGETSEDQAPTHSDPHETSPDECAAFGVHETCTTASGATGARLCEVGQDGYVWSSCAPIGGCQPGQSMACFAPGSPMAAMWGGLSTSCTLVGGTWQYDPKACSTPLVLAFDDEPVTFTNPAGAFDLAGRDTLVKTDWVSSQTPWLVLDRNANGIIDDGSELFGSMTRLADGQRAMHGFLALAPLDADRDGWITARDPAFARLALWRDLDQDRVSSADELTPAGDSVVALSLAYRDVPRCSAGNCERERAELVYRDRDGNERRGSVVDVYFAER